MDIYIVRHGQTLFNYLERVQGWSDSPLTALGIQQGKEVGEHLSLVKFDSIYSSDLKRAVDTAKYIEEKQKSDLEIKETELLREAYYGGFEGGSEEGPWTPVFENYDYAVEAIQENFSESLNKILKEQSNKDIRDIIAGSDDMNLAENYEQYSSRINRFLDTLLGEDYNKVLIVCHGGTSQLLLEILLEESENISEPENCSTSIVEVRNNTIELVKFNDISYLK
ncbi:probable phosphoglycerate mutase [Atopostipes suicloacalis DSM 15692]|uniref:Probable phosphoglycerate mutase n=1 Tax=Atopostipes suicloacalis DSM 15692 TaxID=1121025 RepID=A0A1M4UKD9_9LACT|nr:histidine phosphatase family protein [Atopostipes suicloacalis]SHE57040.1 probable phosphoglycerate mutase [Atopostipes suicloacalis DSM 15692]